MITQEHVQQYHNVHWPRLATSHKMGGCSWVLFCGAQNQPRVKPEKYRSRYSTPSSDNEISIVLIRYNTMQHTVYNRALELPIQHVKKKNMRTIIFKVQHAVTSRLKNCQLYTERTLHHPRCDIVVSHQSLSQQKKQLVKGHCSLRRKIYPRNWIES